MGKVTGFMEFERQATPYRDVGERVHDWREVMDQLEEPALRVQGARCMDCGIPFCHTGCPINNIIPDWKRPGLSGTLGRSLAGAAFDQ